MKNKKVKAFILRKPGIGNIKTIEISDLMKGNVLVKIKYSSFNYKDGLAILNKGPIVKRYPMIPGSDFAGIVEESTHKRFKKGDKVICNGWGIGEKFYGGFSTYANVNGDWLIHLPENFSLEQSMIIGAAGYTASLCVQELTRKINKKSGDVIVTGASGGVGSISTNLLSNLGYKVSALSNKDSEFLKDLGATKVLKRDEIIYSDKPLSKQKWSGVIDTVGGDILASLLSEVKYNGLAVSTGLAKSFKLNTTVYPFILRNITLSGIDCVYASYRKRVSAWNFLSNNLDKNILNKIKTVKTLNDLVKISKDILAGKIKGRILIKV